MMATRKIFLCSVMRLILGLVMLSGVAFLPGPAVAEPSIYIAPQRFTWREFADGERAVKESGTLFGIGFTYPIELRDQTTITPRAELFFGSVDYDGHACDSFGVCQPSTTSVNYFGLKLEGDVGYRFKPRSFFIEPFFGLGFRAWTRDIKDGTAADGSAVAGYTEDWLSLYARVGLRGGHVLSATKQIFAEAGIKLPIYNENTARVSQIGEGPDITLHPGKQAAFFAETGVRISQFKASLFYDSLRFPQSDIETNGFIAAYQPRSTMDIYGVKLGVVF